MFWYENAVVKRGYTISLDFTFGMVLLISACVNTERRVIHDLNEVTTYLSSGVR